MKDSSSIDFDNQINPHTNLSSSKDWRNNLNKICCASRACLGHEEAEKFISDLLANQKSEMIKEVEEMSYQTESPGGMPFQVVDLDDVLTKLKEL